MVELEDVLFLRFVFDCYVCVLLVFFFDKDVKVFLGLWWFFGGWVLCGCSDSWSGGVLMLFFLLFFEWLNCWVVCCDIGCLIDLLIEFCMFDVGLFCV